MSIREKEQRGGRALQPDRLQDNQGRNWAAGSPSGRLEGGPRRVAVPRMKQTGCRVNKGRTASLYRTQPSSPCLQQSTGRETKLGCVRVAAEKAIVLILRLRFLGAACMPALCAPPAPLLKAGVGAGHGDAARKDSGPGSWCFQSVPHFPAPCPAVPGLAALSQAQILGSLSVAQGWGLEGSATSEWP